MKLIWFAGLLFGACFVPIKGRATDSLSFRLTFKQLIPEEGGAVASCLALYSPADKMLILSFAVPYMDYRFGTTTNDFCTLRTPGQNYTYKNLYSRKGQAPNHYFFTISLPKKTMLEILSKKLELIRFHFTPNTDVEPELRRLAGGRALDRMEKKWAKWASKTVVAEVSDTGTQHQPAFALWLHRLP